ncbi:unnamed protein product [Candidula unifasciata]|uniref:Insulin-like domain-containing protein n=1 Tax=Candidula unifasciata TaxID=100452 RepID=A0A8S4A6W3_9EUPU|nr:unnamed protein product [Candidula unifasciata]
MTKFLNFALSRAGVYILILTLVQLVGVTHADLERVCDYRSRAHHEGFCGANLDNMLHLVCSGLNVNVPSKFIAKRQTDNFQNINLRSIMLNKKDALSYLAKRENPGNIVCECCYNPCTIYELSQYCDLPSHVTNRFRISQATALAN